MSLKIPCRRIAQATLALFLMVSPFGVAAPAQDWPISNPPVESSVPQYRPRKQVSPDVQLAPSDFQPAPVDNSVNQPQASGESVLANDFQTPAEIYAPTEISADAIESAAAFGSTIPSFEVEACFQQVL